MKNQNYFAEYYKKYYLCGNKILSSMYTLRKKSKKVMGLLMNILFWIGTAYLFLKFSVIRPFCIHHAYKEVLCVILIMVVVLITQRFSVPKLYLRGNYTLFWLLSLVILLVAAIIEFILVLPDIEGQVVVPNSKNTYLLYFCALLFLRDSCFFAWFLVLQLYIQQRDTFRAKQRASVMEHRSVQFSLPDHVEASIPIDLILYIQETNHETRVHCTNGETFAISNPLSYCKEMIPAPLWTFDGKDKMVFHRHLSEYFTIQPNQEVREIKTVVLLSQRQFQIFDIIRQHPNCTAPFIRENMSGKDSLRTIEREIALLREKALVTHTGSNKGGGYEVCTHDVVSID